MSLNEWKPLTRDEYDELSVFEKHRHCLILSAYYRRRAGPMKLDKPEPTFPEKWAKYSPLAERVEREVQSLGEVVVRIKTKSRGTYQSEDGFSPVAFEPDLFS